MLFRRSAQDFQAASSLHHMGLGDQNLRFFVGRFRHEEREKMFIREPHDARYSQCDSLTCLIWIEHEERGSLLSANFPHPYPKLDTDETEEKEPCCDETNSKNLAVC